MNIVITMRVTLDRAAYLSSPEYIKVTSWSPGDRPFTLTVALPPTRVLVGYSFPSTITVNVPSASLGRLIEYFVFLLSSPPTSN